MKQRRLYIANADGDAQLVSSTARLANRYVQRRAAGFARGVTVSRGTCRRRSRRCISATELGRCPVQATTSALALDSGPDNVGASDTGRDFRIADGYYLRATPDR
jgi:hypothetical protein